MRQYFEPGKVEMTLPWQQKQQQQRDREKACKNLYSESRTLIHTHTIKVDRNNIQTPPQHQKTEKVTLFPYITTTPFWDELNELLLNI